jgi:hypothetical protein
MKFLPLMDLHLTHPYYTDGRCRDFGIEPTLDTQSLLKNHRCVLKSVPHGVRILTAVAVPSTQFIPLQKGVTFAFQLRLQNPDFALFTDLTEMAQTVAPLYTNAEMSPGNPVQLALVSRRAWATEGFVVRQPAQEDCFTLNGCPLAGLQPADFAVESLDPISNLTHYDATAKIITINSKTARSGDTFKVTYATEPQRARSVFAEVEIHHNDSLPEIANGPGKFQVAFKAKSARWKYYLIADRPDAQFHIEDKGASPIMFSDENRTDLNQQPDPTDDLAQALAEQYPKMQRLRFVSDDLIPYRQEARKSIQLRLNGNQVAGALPNPSLRNYSTTQVTRNGNSQKEDALFQVIKYFTH